MLVIVPRVLLGQMIDFETVPGSAPWRGRSVDTMYLGAYGLAFSTSDGSTIVLEDYGGVGGAYGNEDGRMDGLAPGYDRGRFFANLGMAAGRYVILTFTDPTPAAGLDILDVDGVAPVWEQWTVRVYDAGGVLRSTKVITAGDPGTRDGVPTRCSFDFGTTPTIKRMEIEHTGGCPPEQVGWGFDNVSLVATTPPAGGSTLFGLVDTGEIFASTDGGAHWEVRSTLQVHDAIGLAAGYSPSHLWLMTRSGVVYVSSDAGTSWVATDGVDASDVVEFEVRGDGSLVVLTAAGDLWQSATGVTDFTVISSLGAPDCASMTRAHQGMFALTRSGSVMASEDDGLTWQVEGAITTPDAVEILGWGTWLYVLGSAGEVWASSDAGSNWDCVATLSQVHMSGLAVGGGVLVAATQEGEVASSSNGVAWNWVGTINQMRVTALGSDSRPTDVPDAPATSLRFSVGAPWPNPLLGAARVLTFPIALPKPGTVELEVFDVRGRRVARYAPQAIASAGRAQVAWDLGPQPAGVFFARLHSGTSTATARYAIVR